MLLLGNHSDRSIIDRIGSALQQRAQAFSPSEAISPTCAQSPDAPTSSTSAHKRPAPQDPEAPDAKKPLILSECFTDLSDSDASSSESISPRDPNAPLELNDVFCSVPGRLSLLSSTSKYKVTLAEIQRRLSHPENLNASILGGILRRAKSKNGGKELRDTLDRLGLSLPAGRRKSATVTLLTSMVEGEAMHLARDFTFICESEFPVDTLAKHMASKKKEQKTNMERRKMSLEAASDVLQEMAEILSKDRSPIMGSQPVPVLDGPMQEALNHFSHCTHGFGTPAILAGINVVLRYVKASMDVIEKPPVVPIQQNLLLNLSHPNSLALLFQHEMLKMANLPSLYPSVTL